MTALRFEGGDISLKRCMAQGMATVASYGCRPNAFRTVNSSRDDTAANQRKLAAHG
jgi:hypothetical protein